MSEIKINEAEPVNVFDAVAERLDLAKMLRDGPGEGTGWSGPYSRMISQRMDSLARYIADFACVHWLDKINEYKPQPRPERVIVESEVQNV